MGNQLCLRSLAHHGFSGLPVQLKFVYYLHKDVALTNLRAHLQNDRRRKPITLGTVAVVCLVLMTLLAIAQVTHVHAIGSDADHCQLCVAMHSLVPSVVLLAAVTLVRICTVAPPLHEIFTAIRYWHPTLFSRPPPASC